MTNDMEHLKQETVSGAQLNMDALYQICPQCFTESKDPKTGEVKHAVDFEKLRLLLGDNVAEGDERYDFTWVGKRAALQEAAKPIRKTLRPCPEESVDWENTKNLYIEGDNLEVLKLLQNSYMGKVKMIYIDPPYNTGNDFVYQDDFHQTKKDFDLFSGDVTKEGERLVKNTESNGRFHSDWCSMMYSRLMVARTLLTDDGVIFVSIDDNEQANLKKICDEIFGESNFVASTVWRSSDNSNNDAKQFSNDHNLTLIYSKLPGWQPAKILDPSKRTHYKNPDNDPNGPWFDGNPLNSPNYRENLIYDIIAPNGNVIKAPKNGWRWSKETLKQKMDSGEIFFNNAQTNIKRKTYLKDLGGLPPSSLWIDLDKTGHNRQAKYELLDLMPEDVFDTPKPIKLISFIISLVYNSEDAIIMDFFSGSGTTGEAVMQYNAKFKGNRRFILIQLPENLDTKLQEASNDNKMSIKNAISLCDKLGYKHELTVVSKERIRRAGKKILEEQKAKQGDLFSGEQKNLDVGFRVFKCADSNMKDVYYSPADYNQRLLFDLEDNIKEDRNDLDLLFGCMLDWGVTLDLPLRTEKVNGINIHIVNEGDLVACFEKHIPESVIDHIASLLPMRVVLRDSCFDEAKEKMNFFEIFKQRTGWSEEEVRKNVKVI